MLHKVGMASPYSASGEDTAVRYTQMCHDTLWSQHCSLVFCTAISTFFAVAYIRRVLHQQAGPPSCSCGPTASETARQMILVASRGELHSISSSHQSQSRNKGLRHCIPFNLQLKRRLCQSLCAQRDDAIKRIKSQMLKNRLSIHTNP